MKARISLGSSSKPAADLVPAGVRDGVAPKGGDGVNDIVEVDVAPPDDFLLGLDDAPPLSIFMQEDSSCLYRYDFRAKALLQRPQMYGLVLE